MADEDCPDLVSENGYWVTTSTSYTDLDATSSKATFRAGVEVTPDMLGAFSASTPAIAPPTPMAPGIANDLMAHVTGSPSNAMKPSFGNYVEARNPIYVNLPFPVINGGLDPALISIPLL